MAALLRCVLISILLILFITGCKPLSDTTLKNTSFQPTLKEETRNPMENLSSVSFLTIIGAQFTSKEAYDIYRNMAGLNSSFDLLLVKNYMNAFDQNEPAQGKAVSWGLLIKNKSGNYTIRLNAIKVDNYLPGISITPGDSSITEPISVGKWMLDSIDAFKLLNKSKDYLYFKDKSLVFELRNQNKTLIWDVYPCTVKGDCAGNKHILINAETVELVELSELNELDRLGELGELIVK